MSTTRSVKNPKNEVVSCWVCTFVLVVMDIMRVVMLPEQNMVWAWAFRILIVIWVIISVYQTVKYMKNKKKMNH